MTGTHLVKKYANRKLYDTVTRRYITLDTVAGLIDSGTAVRVVDQSSGKDITAATLRQLGGAPAPASPGRHRPSAARRQRRPAVVTTIKGGSQQLSRLLRASLALPAGLAQGAVGTVGQRGLEGVFGPRKERPSALAELESEVVDLRRKVERLSHEVERLEDALGAGR